MNTGSDYQRCKQKPHKEKEKMTQAQAQRVIEICPQDHEDKHPTKKGGSKLITDHKRDNLYGLYWDLLRLVQGFLDQNLLS